MILFLALTAAEATSALSAKDDPIVCVRENIGSEVGTHMRPKRVCMKKSERDFIEKSQQQTVQRINNNGNDRMATPVQGR